MSGLGWDGHDMSDGGWLDGGRGGMMRGGITKKPKRSEQRYINEELHVFPLL